MTTLATVQRVLAEELDLNAGDLEPGRSLEELGIDSLAVIEVMFKLEEEFGIRMSEQRVPIKTVQDIVDIVDALLRDSGKTGK